MAYVEAGIESLLGDGTEETTTEGIMVSAIAIRVIHCEVVRTSPSGGEGKGLSNGASRFNSVLVIFCKSYGVVNPPTLMAKSGSECFVAVYSSIINENGPKDARGDGRRPRSCPRTVMSRALVG